MDREHCIDRGAGRCVDVYAVNDGPCKKRGCKPPLLDRLANDPPISVIRLVRAALVPICVGSAIVKGVLDGDEVSCILNDIEVITRNGLKRKALK